MFKPPRGGAAWAPAARPASLAGTSHADAHTPRSASARSLSWRPAMGVRRHTCALLQPSRRKYAVGRMPSTWIWMQVAIVVFVVIGMIIAITKLV